MQLSIIVPVHNEEKTLAEIISRLKNAFGEYTSKYEIIIVNDGSNDGSEKIIQELNENNLLKLNHVQKSGKGKAVITGLSQAKGKYVTIQDADLEYDPKNLFELFKIAEIKKEIIFGKRNVENGYLLSQLGNKILAMICNLLFPSNFNKIEDPYTCYKIIPREILKKLKLKSSGFEIEAEITAKLLKKKINVLEIPINYEPRSFSEGKHISWRDGYRGILKFLEVKFFN